MDDTSEKPPLISGGCYDSRNVDSSCEDTFNTGGYFWPPTPLHDPYYSMAMMVYKDPALICAPYTSVPGSTDTCTTGHVFATVTNKGAYELCDEMATAAASSGHPSSSLHQQHEMAILKATSTTLPQQTYPSASSSSASEPGSGPENSKLFPADYLSSSPHPRNSGSSSVTSPNPGVINLPNPTAFMLLRTLELQETI